MIALICVDGTGPSVTPDAAGYDRSYAESHVHHCRDYWPDKTKVYYRGPCLAGLETDEIARSAYASALVLHNLPGVKGLFLVGHSRGGAAVIQTAKWLEREGIGVDYMALFDAVDMSTEVTVKAAPANVKAVRHARRDPAGKSRPWWGNCGTGHAVGTKYEEQYFHCTHGAIGGVPYTEAGGAGYIQETGELLATRITPEMDAVGASLVWAWMWPALLARRAAVLGVKTEATAPVARQGSCVVMRGDSLSYLAGKFWGDPLLWPVLYEANHAVVGPNPNHIYPGMTLVIPDISRVPAGELQQVRNRGRMAA